MNESGGEIKVTSDVMLEQSSILADKKKVEFVAGQYLIPSCYYEFDKRYNTPNRELFSRVIANSAAKIFESTDLSLQD